MSSVTETLSYAEDAELVWQAILYYVASMGYTISERTEATRQLICRTPAATLRRSAGQVIAIAVTPLEPRGVKLAVRVTSFDEKREKWFEPWLLRVPREQLIDELKSGISRLLPVIAPPAPATLMQASARMPGPGSPRAGDATQKGGESPV